MPTIRVDVEVAAAREPLFAELSDHGGMGRFSPVKKAALLREGSVEHNGLGALRRVHFRPVGWVEEEITAYDAPSSFEYRILKARPLPFDHQGGRIELEPVDADRTRVLWVSPFEIPIPVIGTAVGRWFAGQADSGFRAILSEAATIASSSRGPG